MKKLLCLFLFALPLFAQVSIPVVNDTTELKALYSSGLVLLKQYGKGDQTGGGFFMRIDSTYDEGTYAFNAVTTGQQWVRMGYPSTYFLASNVATATITTANITTLNATGLNHTLLQADSTKGLIMKSSDGKKWLLRVYTNGSLKTDSTGLN